MDGPRWGGVIGDYPVERTAVVAAALLGEPAEREDTATKSRRLEHTFT